MTAPAAPRERSRSARIARAVVAALLVAAIVSLPWTGPRLLAHLAFFRVRKVEIRGAVYLPPAELIARLRLDSTASVWDDPEPLVQRIERHPQIREARIDRKLPGTLVVNVRENLPVALVPAAKGFSVIDEHGQPLPIDPASTKLDLPILAARDTAIARLLAALRTGYPALFARVSEIRREGRNELLVRLPDVRVRALADVTADRLAEILPVEDDLARRHLAVAELDLRYRDQVIARLQ
ncbi:MAG: FtsQ-type POTRA domain-containing protein [Gemmatimonadaceae bacterium]|nr:FtsQ-type POTRA domain-containing protein [Gemmatimonadaceae bacterium]NUQ93501.1 FtsQ-type POTRA domain-containing protein [Gemmatimonadaceae bacterium]NUR20937.1 FtsQ-type POTRA domain-containing protein [Gemmatimonadaceae bacterium]NUS98685.1 FtsQ-type POTRA domain-containing protein [Gemmatimonadaceae bacterium]